MLMHFWDRHKTITRYYELLTATVCEKYQLRRMEYDILMFLYNSPQYNTAADIAKVRKSTKSHVSTSLKVLEDRGLIVKKTDEENKKHIEIFISEAADAIINDGLKMQKRFARDMLDGLSKEETAVCKRAFEKICDNAEKLIEKEELHNE